MLLGNFLNNILESEIDTKPKQTLSDDVVNLFNSSEFASMPIQPDRTFDNFVVGDVNPATYCIQVYLSGHNGIVSHAVAYDSNRNVKFLGYACP